MPAICFHSLLFAYGGMGVGLCAGLSLIANGIMSPSPKDGACLFKISTALTDYAVIAIPSVGLVITFLLAVCSSIVLFATEYRRRERGKNPDEHQARRHSDCIWLCCGAFKEIGPICQWRWTSRFAFFFPDHIQNRILIFLSLGRCTNSQFRPACPSHHVRRFRSSTLTMIEKLWKLCRYLCSHTSLSWPKLQWLPGYISFCLLNYFSILLFLSNLEWKDMGSISSVCEYGVWHLVTPW